MKMNLVILFRSIILASPYMKRPGRRGHKAFPALISCLLIGREIAPASVELRLIWREQRSGVSGTDLAALIVSMPEWKLNL
jgi:hypothetical protein